MLMIPVCRMKHDTIAAAHPATTHPRLCFSRPCQISRNAAADAHTNGTSVMYVHDDQRNSGWNANASVAAIRPKRGIAARRRISWTIAIVTAARVSVERRSTKNVSPKMRVQAAPHNTIARRLTAVNGVN